MDIFTAIKIMKKKEFVVVTDGLFGEFDMSFGWKISTLERETIADNAGLAFGQASSFQAKGYGVLSALSFFCWAMEYTATTTKLKGQLYLDNKGVITQIKQQRLYPHDYSFNTLSLDWDVIAQISKILSSGNWVPIILHIHRHQDKHKMYDELSLPAKLNVDADMLAVEYRIFNKKTTRKAICLPVNAVQLHINGVTVNSNYFLKLKKLPTKDLSCGI
jgi:hypothetical protein